MAPSLAAGHSLCILIRAIICMSKKSSFVCSKTPKVRLLFLACAIKELKPAAFSSPGRQPEVRCFPNYLVFTLQHLYFNCLFTSRDDYFENLGETNVLACEVSTSGFRAWLKDVTCLSSLFTLPEPAVALSLRGTRVVFPSSNLGAPL